MIKKLFSATIIFCSLMCAAQDFPPILSKQQMYEDFDEFIFILENANPQLPIRKIVTGYHQLDTVKSLRPRIDTIQDYFRFISLLDIALGYMYDIHAVMERQSSFGPWIDTTRIDTKIINKIYTWYRERTNELNEQQKQRQNNWYFPCNPSYIDGNYYLQGFYGLINHKKNDTLHLKNARIISYNNSPYDDYVLKNSGRFFKGSVRWDFKRNKYYCKSSAFLKDGELVVENEDGNILSINLGLYPGTYVLQLSDTTLSRNPDFKFYSPTHKREKRVLYFEKDKILYVYLNDMSDLENKTAEKVKEIGKDKAINKVIIDVRGNVGGGDYVWHNLLKAIVADSLIYNPQMAFLNTELTRQYFVKNPSDTAIVEILTFKWLPETKYIVKNYAPHYFVPDTNSLKYTGKIYVLQDEDVFSAGHSLTSYCRHIEQLISVGEPTGLLAGFGIAPLLYQLQHSKFSFRLEPVIDVTNVNSALDVYQDFPEIVIEFPFEEKRKYLDYKKFDMQNENNLYKYDYLFKKVLALE